ncbi:MAG: hypothetical protein ABL995_15245 [Bryobacteraceae bacterium]
MENLVFLAGASVFRCSSCQVRQAEWANLRWQLGTDETDQSFLWVFAALGSGIIFCLAIALLMLRRAHRWPF